ncbi:hypothetical protein EDF60_1554 [Leucobacter luti]|uniref:hypothetical protein n=1 Tax=Leucobacter luti TaxID=340320 RepID=UPI0010466763|nr:hypothetical protein [Leucobacter luti]MCW2286909.1 hypothetical protein [Leucobacter luti]TCK41138.1 hypothetical protein EDF60_1554 [Leucobacter luti]
MSDFEANGGGSGSGAVRPGPRPGAPVSAPVAPVAPVSSPAAPASPAASAAPLAHGEESLLSRIDLIEAQPLPQRAEGFAQLHDELLAELQRGDHGGV